MIEPTERDVLFLAMTRPTMRMGVPVEGLVINIIAQCYAFIWIGHGNLLWEGISLLWFPIVHLPMRFLTSLDPNIFRELRLWAEVRGIQLKTRVWGGPILYALPHGIPKSAREIAGSV